MRDCRPFPIVSPPLHLTFPLGTGRRAPRVRKLMARAHNARGSGRVRSRAVSVVLDIDWSVPHRRIVLATTGGSTPRNGFNGGMMRSLLVSCADDASEMRTCNDCSATPFGKFLFVQPLRLAMGEVFILGRLQQGLPATPTLLPDVVTSCRVMDDFSTQTEPTQCGTRSCRDGAKIVGRRLRYLSDTLNIASSKSNNTGKVVLHDWLTDLLTTCVCSLVTWWKSCA
ncbi:hypothetical protein MTO96_051451 [Rhipicephalus appendiculatus]